VTANYWPTVEHLRVLAKELDDVRRRTNAERKELSAKIDAAHLEIVRLQAEVVAAKAGTDG
jgi:hypothetical protein